MGVKSFEDLIIWQQAIELVAETYKKTQLFPRKEIFGLTSQMRRSAVSVPSNIAEGQGRLTKGEFRQFLGHARGSLYELQTQVKIAAKLEYLDGQGTEKLIEKINKVGQLLNGLLRSLD